MKAGDRSVKVQSFRSAWCARGLGLGLDLGLGSGLELAFLDSPETAHSASAP